jgi:hypothetical protein
MTHAFRDLYCCKCEACQIKGDIFKSSGERHDTVWYTIAGLIQELAHTHAKWKLPNISLDIYDPLEKAIIRGLPTRDEFSKFDLEDRWHYLDRSMVMELIGEAEETKRLRENLEKRSKCLDRSHLQQP